MSTGSHVHPEPTAEEAAAIAAALEVVLAPAAVSPAATGTSSWRWSGRWWTRPVPARRDRPA